MKTLVVYDSAFGNTQKIAEAIGAGILGAEVRYVDQVKADDLNGLEMLVVGSPTQKMHYIEGMQQFLNDLPNDALSGIKVAAFDTRISIPDVKNPVSRMAARVFLHRYAAEPIAAKLKEKGGQEVVAPEGFFVLDTEGPIKDGELERATAWGREIAQAVTM